MALPLTDWQIKNNVLHNKSDKKRIRKAPQPKKEWLIVLQPRFSMTDLLAAVSWLQGANEETDNALFHWQLCSNQGQVVLADNGMVLSALRDFSTVESFDGVLLLDEIGSDNLLQGWLDQQYRQSKQVISLCSINKDDVCDKNNELAESMAEIILPWLSPEQSRSLQSRMQAQSSGNSGIKVDDSRVHRAIQLMRENLEQPLSSNELAERAFLSVRQLERLFRRYFDITPSRYYTRIRLYSARKLLQQTDMSVTDVALSCGFVSLSHFCKLYRQQFGLTPGDDKG